MLDYDERHRRRVTMTGVRGLDFLLDLPEAVMLRAGDGLVLDDGRIVEVVAAPEPLAEIARADAARWRGSPGTSATATCRPRFLPNSLRIRRDPVIEEMARGSARQVVAIEAPFDPEAAPMCAGRGRDHRRSPSRARMTHGVSGEPHARSRSV